MPMLLWAACLLLIIELSSSTQILLFLDMIYFQDCTNAPWSLFISIFSFFFVFFSYSSSFTSFSINFSSSSSTDWSKFSLPTFLLQKLFCLSLYSGCVLLFMVLAFFISTSILSISRRSCSLFSSSPYTIACRALLSLVSCWLARWASFSSSRLFLRLSLNQRCCSCMACWQFLRSLRYSLMISSMSLKSHCISLYSSVKE